MNKPKILIFDIETAPNLSYTWGKYKQNVIDFKNEWFVLCFAAKWLDSKKIISYKLPDFKLFKKDKQNDREVVKELWKLFDEADIIIGHNSDKFDIKKINARFIYHNLIPPSPYKTIDTLKEAKKHFKFTSNKLDDISKYLKIGEKTKHTGFNLWLDCMTGNKKAWKLMTKYNKTDVILTEKLYKKILPWITNHPNYGVYVNEEHVCPYCGSTHLVKHGFSYTKTHVYQRWQCMNCYGYSQSIKSKNVIKPTLK